MPGSFRKLILHANWAYALGTGANVLYQFTASPVQKNLWAMLKEKDTGEGQHAYELDLKWRHRIYKALFACSYPVEGEHVRGCREECVTHTFASGNLLRKHWKWRAFLPTMVAHFEGVHPWRGEHLNRLTDLKGKRHVALQKKIRHAGGSLRSMKAVPLISPGDLTLCFKRIVYCLFTVY